MSTRLALTVVGTVVGAYFGYPQLGAMAGAMIGSAVDPTTIQGPRINESGTQTVSEGLPRNVVFGTWKCSGNVIQTGPLVKQETSTSQGKGSTKIKGEIGLRTYAVGICEGEMGGLLRVWRNRKLVYDIRLGSGMEAESAKWIANKRFYPGSETQLPDPALELLDADTPAYRGSCYMAFEEDDVTDVQGAIPQYEFEVASAASFAPGPDTLAPLVAALMWRSQTFSATFTEYRSDEEAAVYASGEAQANISPYGDLLECYVDGAPEDNTWKCNYEPANVQNFATTLINWRDIPGPEYTLVVGTAKQLAQVEYRSDLLYQQGLGPVLLPGDPNYDNATFWADQRAAAIAAGTLHADVSSPVVVPEYALLDGGDTGQGNPVSLSSIVQELYRRCGVKSSRYDVSELTDMVRGYGLSSAGYTGADAIDALRMAYFFDKSAHDKKIYHPKRGKVAVKTLTVADLTQLPESTKREQTAEIPYKLNVRYPNSDSGWAVLKETTGSDSPDRRTTGEVTLDVAVSLSSDEAAQIADKQYKTMLAEIDGTVELPIMLDAGTDLAEADCIGWVGYDSSQQRVRIEQMEFDNWSLKLSGKADRQSAYTSSVTGLPAPAPELPPSTIPGDTELAIIDGPARTDSEDDISYLAAATGSLPPWYGAELERSFGGGANYTDVMEFDAPAIMGVLLEDITAAAPYFTDTTNTVKVQFYREGASIDSLTPGQFLSRQGVFALQNSDGSWEYMQAKDVDEQIDGSFWLTTLHRGIANSGGSAHTAGAKFVWLADATYVPASSAWLGAALTHQATSFGESSDDTTNDQTQTYVGRAQQEWGPAYLRLSRDASNLITATWVGRGRFGNAFHPVMSKNFTGYRVTVTDGTTTTTTDTASQTYTGTWANPVTVSVVALNRITGAGPATSGTV